MDPWNIPSFGGLVELTHQTGVDIRPTLLIVSTDLYVAKDLHSPEEERHYTELALRLIDLVDASTRAAMAERLADYSQAPAAVMRRLLAYGAPFEVENGGQVETVPFDAPAVHSVADPSDPMHELNELFFTAEPEERRLILLNLGYSKLPRACAPPRPLAGKTVENLESAALTHQVQQCIQELERSLGISRSQARRVIEDPSGEPIVVAALALGMPADVLQRILLCLNAGISHSVERVYQLSALYDEIATEDALRLLKVWQECSKAANAAEGEMPAPSESSAHQPHYALAEPPRRESPAPRPAIRWEEYVKRKLDGAA